MSVERWAGVALLTAALGGCADVGLPEGLNIPVEQAMHAQPVQAPVVSAEPTLAAGQPLPSIRLGGQSWVATGSFLEVSDRFVQPAGSAAGHVFYTLTWDQPPYDRVLASRPGNRWQEYRAVLGADRVGTGGAQVQPTDQTPDHGSAPAARGGQGPAASTADQEPAADTAHGAGH